MINDSLGDILVGSSGASRTVTLIPRPGQIGSSQITLTVSDGSLVGSGSFTLMVVLPNESPAMQAVANQVILEDGATGELLVAISDAETPASALTFSASSTTNATLLPASGIVLGGTGANRTVTLRPAANANGLATVRLTVSDGVNSASIEFTLTVSPVNDAPVNTSIPTLSGLPASGSALTATTGAWNDAVDGGTTINYTYSWSRASNATGTEAIIIASTPAYTPVAADVGKYLRVAVKATDNGAPGVASATAFSAPWALTRAAMLVNTPPRISVVTDKTTAQDSILEFTVTIGDTESLIDKLRLTVASDNNNLVNDSLSDIRVNQQGAQRLVSLRVRPGQVGTSKISLTVKDDGFVPLSTTTSFILTVTRAAQTVAQEGTAPTTSEEPASLANDDSGSDSSSGGCGGGSLMGIFLFLSMSQLIRTMRFRMAPK